MAFICEICGQNFTCSYNLTRHRNTVHARRYWLPAQQRGGSLDNEPTHLDVPAIHNKAFPCGIRGCGQIFACRYKLMRHMDAVHVNIKAFSCKICGNLFSRRDHLTRHMNAVHVNIKAFSCKICGNLFSRRDNLMRHRNSIHTRRYWQSVQQRGGTFNHQPPHLDDPELHVVYRQYRKAIQSFRRDHGCVHQIHNRQLFSENTRDLEDELWEIFRVQEQVFKINFSYGFVLRHVETGELRYFHASQNNCLLDLPLFVRNKEDYTTVLEEIHHKDVLEFVRQQRPDTKWNVHIITNLSVYINPLAKLPIESPVTTTKQKIL